MNGLLGVIMAGGMSERMRLTNDGTHKALVKVAGISLLERSVRKLLKRGISEVVVVSSANEPRLAHVVENDLNELARAYRARLRSYVEAEPLGTIGAVRLLASDDTDVLVTNVDNLTTLDETALVNRHRETGAAMTIATHRWPLGSPFGELEVANGFVAAYKEKPVRELQISSGSCVVSPAAAASIPRDRPYGANELCQALLKRGLPVAAYCHDEPWVDVNDALALHEAERLASEYGTRFE